MSEVWYYKGLHKVKVVTTSEGYWIIEALEDFEDSVNGKRIEVIIGETRIVPVSAVSKRKYLRPPIKEHSYELQMEENLRKRLEKDEKKPK